MMDSRTEQVSEGMVKIEREIETGMEKAKEKVKEEMSSEMKEIKERSGNVVLYGVEESGENDTFYFDATTLVKVSVRFNFPYIQLRYCINQYAASSATIRVSPIFSFNHFIVFYE